MAQAGKYGKPRITGIPDDEPVFILRARDALALDTITAYAKACEAVGTDDRHVMGVEASHAQFVAWRDANAELVKLPDTAGGPTKGREVPAA